MGTQGRLKRRERHGLAQAAGLAVLAAGGPLTTSELLFLLERAGAAPPGRSRSGRLRQLASVLEREGAGLGFKRVQGRFPTISTAGMGRPAAAQWRLDLASFLGLDGPQRELLGRLVLAAESRGRRQPLTADPAAPPPRPGKRWAARLLRQLSVAERHADR